MKDKVYIISRYSGTAKEVAFNKKVARYYCRKLVAEGKVPIAPHLYYTQFLDDQFEDDRNKGLDLGLLALQECQEYMAVIVDGIISRGMSGELEEAKVLGLPGHIVNVTKREIKELMKVVR